MAISGYTSVSEVQDADRAYLAVDDGASGFLDRSATGLVLKRQFGAATPIASAPGVGDDSADGYRAGSLVLTAADVLYVCTDATAGAAVWVKVTDAALNKFDATAAPTANDDTGDGYSPGSLWVDLTNDKAYICLDATSTAAVWTEITQSGSGSGDVVGPASAVNERIAVFDGTTGKLLKDGGSTIAAIVAGAGGRTLLSADTTYYVDGTLGDDLNDGTSSGAGAWATIGKALEVIGAQIDLGGYTLTVDIANGTYTDAADYFNLVSPAGTGTILFDGDTATPSNVVFSKGVQTLSAGQNHPGVYWQFQGIDFAVGASIIPVWVSSGTVKLSNVRIGVCANAMLVETSGYLVIETALELYGNCGAFIWSRYGGLVRIFTTTFTFTGSPAFSFGWYAQADGRILTIGTITNSGTVTGKKYDLNGLCIATGTTNAPGSTAGSVANGAIAITTVI